MIAIVGVPDFYVFEVLVNPTMMLGGRVFKSYLAIWITQKLLIRLQVVTVERSLCFGHTQKD